MADTGSMRVAFIGMYLLCAFLYLMFLICDVAELWSSTGKSPDRIFSYGTAPFFPCLQPHVT